MNSAARILTKDIELRRNLIFRNDSYEPYFDSFACFLFSFERFVADLEECVEKFSAIGFADNFADQIAVVIQCSRDDASLTERESM